MSTALFLYEDNLRSARIITRKLTLNDIGPWSRFFEEPEAIQYFPDLGLSTNETRAEHWILKQLDRYKENRFGLQALIDKDTNEFIGQCGLLLQDIDGEQKIEVGYHIFKKYWGKGYAPEAAKLFIDYAFENNLTESIISIIDIRNTNSQRVAVKNGLKLIKQTRWYNLDVYIFELNCNLH